MENKTSKYFKYAIGEIILVVIGILIALQINNWNESRKLQEEINTYLTQKLVNLREDQIKLVELREFRLNAAEKSKQFLDNGIKKTDVIDFIETTKRIFTERRFTSTVERNETSTTKYYWSKKEALINNLEQEYMRIIEVVMFEENRLNTFSESIEIDLWRDGYFIDNRRLYNSMIKDLKPSDFEDETIPTLILNKENGQQSLEGLLNRNEIVNPSIALKLKELIQTNEKLISVIEDYLNL
ncbi:DUF6090 family protein [Geojedonia litorea]|uniref:DUF6090 family protein n=1 Tax=Geojedonia litorea TaxID=1268269 RepID=A0ABV9MXW8_9FLAO